MASLNSRTGHSTGPARALLPIRGPSQAQSACNPPKSNQTLGNDNNNNKKIKNPGTHHSSSSTPRSCHQSVYTPQKLPNLTTSQTPESSATASTQPPVTYPLINLTRKPPTKTEQTSWLLLAFLRNVRTLQVLTTEVFQIREL